MPSITPITRDQLAKFLPDNDTIRRFEQLFALVGTINPENIDIIFRLIEEVVINAGSAVGTANQANASIEALAQALALLAVAPPRDPVIFPDDLSPPIQIGTMGEQQADRVNITGGTIAGVSFSGATITNPTITGGTINNTTIGATTPAAITGTTVAGTTVTGSTSVSGGTLASTTTTTVGTLLDISAAGAGQIKFPAAQNSSLDVNTLDDYEEGSFTPTLTFTTPGDVSVTYSARVGRYTKIGQQVTINMRIATSAFTWSTSTGVIVITGMPFAEISIASLTTSGSVGDMSGFTVTAGRTSLTIQFTNTETQIAPVAMNPQAGTAFNISTAESPSGVNKTIVVGMTYITGS